MSRAAGKTDRSIFPAAGSTPRKNAGFVRFRAGCGPKPAAGIAVRRAAKGLLCAVCAGRNAEPEIAGTGTEKEKDNARRPGNFSRPSFRPFLQKRAGRRSAPGGLTFAGRFAIMKSRAKTRPDGAGRSGTIQSLFRTEGFYIFLTFFYHFRKTREL